MRVKIRLDDLKATAERARAEFAKTAEEMNRLVGLGAELERAEHRYQNRTGNLERSTMAHVISSSMRMSRVDLEMGFDPDAPYASYVVGRGFSAIGDVAERVESWLDDFFVDQAVRVAGR